MRQQEQHRAVDLHRSTKWIDNMAVVVGCCFALDSFQILKFLEYYRAPSGNETEFSNNVIRGPGSVYLAGGLIDYWPATIGYFSVPGKQQDSEMNTQKRFLRQHRFWR